MEHKAQDEAQSVPTLCKAGCGFFANPECSDLCSKCSRELRASEAAANAIASSAAPAIAAAKAEAASVPASQQSPTLPADKPAVSPTASNPAAVPDAGFSLPQMSLPSKLLHAQQQPSAAVTAAGSSGDAAQAAADNGASEEPPRRVQKNTSRCFSCNKKIGLTGFKCRCGYVFCGPHRLAEAHACDYDYKGAGRESLAKANPLVQADRIARF